MRIGQEAKVSVDSMVGKEFLARVRRINPNVEAMSGTVKVVLDFDADSRQYLREAAFARVKLVMETHQNVIIVPKDALIEENARTYLMIVKEQPATEGETSGKPALTAERVEVQTGLEDSNNTEITSGIADTAQVITLGQHTLKSGSSIVITNAEEQLAAKAGINPKQVLSEAEKKNEAEDSGSGAGNEHHRRIDGKADRR